MSNKISVYGGTGFIGSAFQKVFYDEVILIPREERKPQTNNIVYFLSTTSNYNIFDDPHIDINTNLNILMEVLEHCKNTDITFNYISTGFVYGSDILNAKETDHCDPKGFYSITKRTAEQLLIAYCETFKIKYRILRFANVLGLNDTKVSSKKNALTYLINRLKKGHDIELNDNGNFIRDYIHVSDLCRAINLIITSGELNAIYNVGNQESTNFGDAIRYAKSKIDSASVIKYIPTSAANAKTKSTLIDCSKLRAL
jgi:nucleoside-diphosphate-sugar epimerase